MEITLPEDLAPSFVSAPEIARSAGVTVKTVTASLRRAGIPADAFLTAGRMKMPLFAMPRFTALVAVVNSKAHTPTPAAP